MARGLNADKKAINSLKLKPSSILNKLCKIESLIRILEFKSIYSSLRGRYLRERIDGEFGNGEKFIGRNETTVVAIELTKTLVKRNDLLLSNYTRKWKK